LKHTSTYLNLNIALSEKANKKFFLLLFIDDHHKLFFNIVNKKIFFDFFNNLELLVRRRFSYCGQVNKDEKLI
jgi:hypothetical protein